MSGATVKDIPASQFVTALAAHFKKSGKFQPPANHDLIKTGIHKELAPQDADWYYLRLAAIARKIYLNGGSGVSGLAHSFGGSYSNGLHCKHHQRAATGNIRFAVQALEAAKLVGAKEGKTGRFVTSAGRRELDVLATSIKKATA